MDEGVGVEGSGQGGVQAEDRKEVYQVRLRGEGDALMRDMTGVRQYSLYCTESIALTKWLISKVAYQ